MLPFKDNVKFQCHIKEITIMPSSYYICLGYFTYKYNRYNFKSFQITATLVTHKVKCSSYALLNI